MGQTDFYHSAAKQPHQMRSIEMLKKHPEIKNLIGRNPNTFWILAGLVTFQMVIAAVLGRMGFGYWWLSLIVAYLVGAFATHPLYAIIHEATHNLIFKNITANKWCLILADLPNTVPGASAFSTFHLKHHSYMGNDQLDADLPAPIEAKIVGNNTVLKALWLALFPVCQIYRALRLHNVNTWTKWMYVNIAVVFLSDFLLVYFFGWNAMFYLIMSMMFALGFHPLGARWIQEHYTLDEHQETYSYYGPINKIGMNIGYHVEHHDFPSIPWHRLPELKKIAPEYYDTLKSYSSWAKLMLNFIFNPEYSLYSRVKR
ncbi:MAG: fatty acid desaturase [Saprospiraceae bacterium]|nr:MAG: fatty acid desaturase [Saprospiraceae bacterium]